MLALQTHQQKQPARQTPNILPCRIHQNGPAKITKRFWSPATEKDTSKTSYFRGRKLRGRVVKVPPGYQGIATKPSQHRLPAANNPPFDKETDNQSEDEDEEENEPVKILHTDAIFDEIVVWGHDQLPAPDDVFLKGVEEWIAFAEAIHLPVDGDGAAEDKAAS